MINMSDNSAYQELMTQYRTMMARLNRVEQENISLLASNDLFKEELQQKTSALQKSTSDYSTLKKQYEELLMLITDLHEENQKFYSPLSSPMSQQPQNNGEQAILKLKKQINQINRRKAEYKEQNQQLIQENDYLKQQLDGTNQQIMELKQWESAYQKFVEIASPILQNFSDSTSPWSYIIESTKQLIDNASHKIDNDKYKSVKSKYKRLLIRCKEMREQVEKNRNILSQILVNQKPSSTYEQEIAKMEKFLAVYDKKSNDSAKKKK